MTCQRLILSGINIDSVLYYFGDTNESVICESFNGPELNAIPQASD